MRREIIVAFVALATVIGIVLLIVFMKDRNQTDNSNKIRSQITLKYQINSEHSPHGVDYLPDFPRPLKSDQHPSVLLSKLASTDFCGDCDTIEQELVAVGKVLIEQIKSGTVIEVPDIKTKYMNSMNSCQPCKLLVETWDRYFNHLKQLSIFVKTGKLPEQPKDVSSCRGCLDVQTKYSRYVKTQLDEINCLLTQKVDCPEVGIPQAKYNADKNCKQCEQTYNQWALYSFVLRDIIKYLRKSL